MVYRLLPIRMQSTKKGGGASVFLTRRENIYILLNTSSLDTALIQ